jgi:hypothetical protein
VIAKPIESITEADLQALVDVGTPENRRLEYKQSLPDNGDQGKVKFLKEVTAFSNTQGGDLIYGMVAKDGIPQKLSPLQVASKDQLLLRLEGLCADGVEPRLTGLMHYRFVPLEAGGDVLDVRVAKSWNAPHRVSTGGHAHFYGRNAGGCYQLDVGELRQVFNLSQTVAERIRAFRTDRLLKIGSGDTPVPLQSGPTLVLHVIPLESFTSSARIEIAGQQQTLWKFAPLAHGSGYTHRINLDGYLVHNHHGTNPAMSYAQLFRDGAIEAVVAHQAWAGDRIFYSWQYEREVVDALREYFLLLPVLGIAPPSYVFLTITGLEGYRLGVTKFRFPEEPYMVDRDSLILPETTVEDWAADPVTIMRPTFDMVWNAFGLERSFNYDEAGSWGPHRQ